MKLTVIKSLALGWLILCLAGSLSASPQRPYRTLSRLGSFSDYDPKIRNDESPAEIYRRSRHEYSENSPYESIDKFQIEQRRELLNGPSELQSRYDYDDGYYSRFRNDQESHYQSLLRVTENPLRDSQVQETFAGSRESQASYYQDYLPLDENDAFNVKPSDDERFTAIDENLKNSTDQKIAVLMEKILSEGNSYAPSLSDLEALNSLESSMLAQDGSPDEIKRGVRQVRQQRPGFLWTIARLAFEKVNDTKSAVNQIGTIINNGISTDDSTPTTTTTSTTTRDSVDIDTTSSTSDGDTTSTTTAAPFRLTGPVLQGIIRRNVKGLIRLFNIEWRDAVNASRTSVRDFQRDLGNQVRPFLEDNPNVFGR